MDLAKLIDTFEVSADQMELNISVDCVLFTIQTNQLKVLLNKLYPGTAWMLPGGFMKKNETSDDAALRILKQRTGVENIWLKQFKVFSDPNRFSFKSLNAELGLEAIPDLSRLPERVISIGYFALVNFETLKLTGGDFEENSIWVDVHNLQGLMFDHNEIIREASKALQKEMYIKPIAYNLLPEKFTMPELQSLYEIILDKPIERSSFQKKMLKWGIYQRLEERREGVAHKRPFLYKFDRDKYEAALNLGIKFGM